MVVRSSRGAGGCKEIVLVVVRWSRGAGGCNEGNMQVELVVVRW